MNFLAHAHLSGNNRDVLLGNFIADAIKGKNFKHFENEVQKGILLHRKIDVFTDTHPVFKRTLERVRGKFGKFGGVVVDIYYDHYLAANWEQYSATSLTKYANEVYGILRDSYSILPERTQRLLPFLVTQNWLVNYATLGGLNLVFQGMDRRTGYRSRMSNATKVLSEIYPEVAADFHEFYPLVSAFAENELAVLDNGGFTSK